MIRVVRNIGNGNGQGMFRTWCDDCADHCQGAGRSQYLSWWLAKGGAVKAMQRHQDQHVAKAKGTHSRIFGMAGDKLPPNSGEWQDITSLPVVPRR
jgi:hypothetical protein